MLRVVSHVWLSHVARVSSLTITLLGISLQKSPAIIGSFAERDLQLKESYANLLPRCSARPQTVSHVTLCVTDMDVERVMLHV